MISEEEFYRAKIFSDLNIFDLRKKYPNQIDEINKWFHSENYKKISTYKSSLQQKLTKITNDKIDNDQLYLIYDWWKKQPKECYYCKISEDDFEVLKSIPGYINKRYPKRGKSLEIDRKKSDLPYTDITNLALACYWCNNAKTDTFTEIEFKKIGNVIKEIWKERFDNHI